MKRNVPTKKKISVSCSFVIGRFHCIKRKTTEYVHKKYIKGTKMAIFFSLCIFGMFGSK